MYITSPSSEFCQCSRRSAMVRENAGAGGALLLVPAWPALPCLLGLLGVLVDGPDEAAGVEVAGAEAGLGGEVLVRLAPWPASQASTLHSAAQQRTHSFGAFS